ncbi:MAG: S9 family peptidase [Bacteroidales bacterium]|nr:S9 family peptidase [Bacteroidales bacterium]
MKRLLAVAMTMALLGSAAAQTKQITLEDIWAKGTFRPSGISSIRSMQDGEHYCVLTRTSIDKYSYRTGEREGAICSFNDPLRKSARQMPPIESYEFSADEQKILLSSGFEPLYRHSGVSDYYVYDVADGNMEKISHNGKQRLTTFSPNGKMVAFVRDNNLYIMNLATMRETQVTTDGKFNEIINGTTDWVYEEEFGITKGFYWSPDSKRIAFYRFDESKVKEYSMQMWGELYPENYTYKYPKAGEDNSVVDVLIYELATSKTLKLDIGSQNDQYIPRIQWTQNPNVLAVMRMNRLQNKMEILLADAIDGDLSALYTETDEAYVEVPDTWMFLNDGKQMLITSERDGYNHIYLYGLDGGLVRQITSGDFDVVAVSAVDEKSGVVYFTSHEDGAINKSLYMVSLKDKNPKRVCLNYKVGDIDKVYDADGLTFSQTKTHVLGTYSAVFSEGCKYYICTYSNANMPPAYTLHDSKGNLVKVLENNNGLQRKMREYGVGNKQFGTLTTSLGTELNYYMILPPDFDSTKRYPLFFYVYGGPGNQQVNNAYGYNDYYWFHMLAQQGYVVACFDGRGTGGRGARFKKMTYRNLGKYECEDAVEAARWFGKKQWIDETRIGIFGWSFGGYLSTLSILKGHDVFKSAIAVAPVITWRYYDNIYTERFLQRPQDNPRGYDDNSPLNFANLLSGNYLLVHGTGDDNVHFQNAVDMVTALETAGKQFEFRIYPNKNHSIYGGNTRLNLYQLMTDFIYRKL